MSEDDKRIRDRCEPHLQRLAEMFAGLFNPVTEGGDAGLLAFIADRLEKTNELLDNVQCTGIEYTNPGRYHVVQINVALWRDIEELVIQTKAEPSV